jgi:hypothetical protein
MKVICIEETSFNFIKVGEVYDLLLSNNSDYYIYDKIGIQLLVEKNSVISIEDHRENILKSILD